MRLSWHVTMQGLQGIQHLQGMQASSLASSDGTLVKVSGTAALCGARLRTRIESACARKRSPLRRP
jgi:hypothetical protein